METNKRVTVCLETLWLKTEKTTETDYEISLSNGNYLRHEYTDKTHYYDLFNDRGVIVCMDGETVEIISVNEYDVILKNIDEDVLFTLSKEEFNTVIGE